MEALNSAGVFADFKLRRAKSVFFPEHIREVPANLPSTALPLPPPEQVSSIQDLTLDAEASTGEGRGKEGLPPTKDAQLEDTLTIKDVVSQAKAAEKSKVLSPKPLILRRILNQQSSCRIFFYVPSFVFFSCGFCHYL